jgi:hypothetical protein
MALPLQKPPFYLKTTDVQENGIDLPLVTLPAGTVLFRGQKIPNPTNVDPRAFYADFLGNPEGSQYVCLNPTHNTFFYPLPYIAFGINDVGQSYDIMNIVVLVQAITVVSMLSPSRFVRGTVKRFSGKSPIQRCSILTQGLCHEQTAKELDALQYDNCLNPEYQMRSSTRGWMAIAEQDALTQKQGGTSAMAAYVKGLEGRYPGKGVELIANSYTDSNRNYGFPEIALYPYRVHKGLKALKRPCRDIKTAIHLMQLEAEADNLNYLPIASITREGTIDMINGLFTYERLGVSANAFTTPALNKQPDIEVRLAEYMDALQTKGLNLPYYGKGKLSFDTRTGFYIFPQVIPRSFQITEKGETFPYRYLTLPLDSSDARKRALTYTLMFRSLTDAKFMQKYGLEKGFGIKRAMIFDRPPVLTRVFQELGIEIPAAFRDGLGRASRIYKENTASSVSSLTTQRETLAIRSPMPMTQGKGIDVARKALLKGMNINDIVGGYGKPINPYGISSEEQLELIKEFRKPAYRPSTPEYRPATPNSPAYRPATPNSPAYRPATPNSPAYRPSTPPTVQQRGGMLKGNVENLTKAFQQVSIENPREPIPMVQEKGINIARKALQQGMNINDIVGGYGKPINPYGISSNEQLELIKEFRKPSTSPIVQQRGGTRSIRVKKKLGTRKVKNTVEYLAKAFHKVWAKLAKN